MTQESAYTKLQQSLCNQLDEIKKAGTFKQERQIQGQQFTKIIANNKEVLNFCANNYLGLSNDPQVIQAAKNTLDQYGYGMSSARFICGTQDIHTRLEQEFSNFYGTQETILFTSCFDANTGLFEAILNEKDAIISDSLNHASIIDGIRLCKSKRFRYNHLDLNDLENKLIEAQNCENRLIVTDGVFSMDGDLAPLDKIVNLGKKYKAMIMVDESHAAGVLGNTGRGTPEIFGVLNDIDIITGTMGKALGGASGGYVTGRKEIIDILRQKARTYIFSNSIAPPIVGATLKVFEILKNNPQYLQNLQKNTKLFRSLMKKAGFKILGNDSVPIAPVYIGDAKIASQFSEELFRENIYAISFSYPVVPKGQARIRVQLSAAHTEDQIKKTVDVFIKAGYKTGLIAKSNL